MKAEVTVNAAPVVLNAMAISTAAKMIEMTLS
jgi:hypothetical protein